MNAVNKRFSLPFLFVFMLALSFASDSGAMERGAPGQKKVFTELLSAFQALGEAWREKENVNGFRNSSIVKKADMEGLQNFLIAEIANNQSNYSLWIKKEFEYQKKL